MPNFAESHDLFFPTPIRYCGLSNCKYVLYKINRIKLFMIICLNWVWIVCLWKTTWFNSLWINVVLISAKCNMLRLFLSVDFEGKYMKYCMLCYGLCWLPRRLGVICFVGGWHLCEWIFLLLMKNKKVLMTFLP